MQFNTFRKYSRQTIILSLHYVVVLDADFNVELLNYPDI